MSAIIWEYRTAQSAEASDLNALGRDGWELIGASAEGGNLIFKRQALSFREQVTLDQKRRYYALWGIETDAAAGGVER